MEKTMLPLRFIATMSAIFLLRTPGGLGDISKGITREFLWFFIPAITAQFIFYSLKLLRMAVGPGTWKKMEDYGIAKKAMFVCLGLEMLALHKMSVLGFSESPFWARCIAVWFPVGFMAFMSACILIMHFWYGKNILKNE